MALLEVKELKVHFPIRGGFFNTKTPNAGELTIPPQRCGG